MIQQDNGQDNVTLRVAIEHTQAWIVNAPDYASAPALEPEEEEW